MALVLCTGTDHVLMETRRMLLEKFGHQVITAANEREIRAACKFHSFDVAVIGQGASPSAKKRILMLIRAVCPVASVLELYTVFSNRVLETADAWLEVPADGPETLPRRVSELAKASSNATRSSRAS